MRQHVLAPHVGQRAPVRARLGVVGRRERDLVADYARRKGMDLATMERWLAPNLAYDPARADAEAAE